MPVTISGDGGIAGISSLGGGDFVAGSLTSSGDLIAGPQAVDRATLFVDDSDNSVSINTTVTPAAGVFLQVADATDPVVSLNNTGHGEVRLGCTAAGGYIGTESNHPFNIEVNSATAVTVLTNGDIGIGTTTPNARLEIEGIGSNTTQFSGLQGLRLQNAYGAAFGGTVDLNFVVGTSTTNRGACIGAEYESPNRGNSLYFATNPNSVNSNDTLIERMRITANGNVGINESTPTNPFHLVTQEPPIDNGNPIRTLFVEGGDGSAGHGGAIALGTRDNLNLAQIKASKINGTFNHYAGEMVFSVNTVGGTMIEAARFTTQLNLAFPNGQGIDFSASEGASATSSILDDYEEGIHETTMTDSLGGALSVSPTNKSLQYVKIGNMVFLSGRPLVGISGGTGYVRFSLPFAIASLPEAAERSAGSVDIRLCDSAYEIGLFNLQMNEGSAFCTLTYGNSNDSVPSTPAMVVGTQIWIAIAYRTA